MFGRPLTEIHEVHFINAHYEVLDTQERCDEAVLGLFHEPCRASMSMMARSAGGTCHHVAWYCT